ncbi:MAG: hypothetical protein C3F12_03075 [Candidatus Methylomirabilota bacterium]|nr:hypothetical protein [Candidatus Methylomirabilis sp.]NJD67537.1 hypothetical protein [candidate division NC10 bacterium]PWB47945.1 MAG: hypothetical protein C3F12_03075 [candidate division NC10 bacterium]
MTNIQRGGVILIGGTSYPCDVKSCAALRGSVYPLPCMDYHRVRGGGSDEGGPINCVLTSGDDERR